VNRLFDLLLRPRIARVRRWSFVLTLPVALAVGQATGYRAGVAVIAARFALWVAVAAYAWRLPGERGDALRDLLMHPRVRALLRAERDVVLTLPRLLMGRRRAPAPALRYQRGDQRLPIALALIVPLVAEGAAEHLLLPHGWLVVQVVLGAAHAYALVWLLAWGLGPRAWPHALDDHDPADPRLIVRGGPLYRAEVPLAAVSSVTATRRRVTSEVGVVIDGECAALPARGRVDLRVELSEPVRVLRPLAEPATVRVLELASDDPDALVRAIRHGALEPGGARWAGAVGGFELAGLAAELAYP
jgi:hypothetical protein